jgi:hypothetical protein
MLIAGCSHAAGSEIDGSQDSRYNREHSFGAVLASMMGYTPVNMAEPGSPNSAIARNVLDWFKQNYNKDTMDVFVVISWTESIRMEVPSERPHWYETHNPHYDFHSNSGQYYWRMNPGWDGGDREEKELTPYYHRFMAENERYLEIVSLNIVLQLQYFLKSLNIDYVMCNSMHMTTVNKHTQFYIDCIDQLKYLNLTDNDKSFYKYYRELGYENPKAKYWHHNEIPHELFAKELYNFIESNRICSS